MEHFALEILVRKEGEKLTPTQAARLLMALDTPKEES